MTHPTDDTLTLAAAGDLPESERADVDAHLAGCAACRDAHAHRVATKQALASIPPPPPDPSFSARLNERRSRRTAPRLAPLVFVTGSLAAAAFLLVPRADPREGFHARGSDEPLSIRVFVHAAGAPDQRRPLNAGTRLRRGDGFSIDLTGIPPAAAHVLAFLRDASGDVHWIAPAWIDAAERPRAVPVTNEAFPGVTPESPAPGAADFCTAITDTPLDVALLDRALTESGVRALDRLGAATTCVTVTIDP